MIMCLHCSHEECKNTYGDDAQCIRWFENEQCTSNPKWMLVNCEKACKQCMYIMMDVELKLLI